MKYWLAIALLLLSPSLAAAVCQPDEGMTKHEVLAECGPPDYAEVIRGDNPDTAIPLSSNDAEILNNDNLMVVWQYDLFDDTDSRIILFRNGQVVRCCLPEMD